MIMKRVYYKSISLVIFFIFVLFSCKKDELKIHELEITSEIFVIGTTSAQITVNYSYMTDLKQVDGYVSTKSDMAEANNFTALIDGKTFVVKFKDLQANTHYYYKFKCFNGVDVIFTDVKTFTTNDYGLPIIMTKEVTDITSTTAICGGIVVDDGGLEVLSRGVCWSYSSNPTTSDNHTIDSMVDDSYSNKLTGLTKNIPCYVRAYASNSKGTNYGQQIVFRAQEYPGSFNEKFSITSSQKVYFSQGNLQYQASTNTWRLAENQWDYVGTDSDPLNSGTIAGSSNHLISANYNGWIDLFGWGTSGYNHGAVCYKPWSNSTVYSDYYAYGNPLCDLNNMSGQADWGFNAIINGGNTTKTWITLTKAQWDYVLKTRNTISGLRYVKAIVNSVKGVILFPDDWKGNTFSLIGINNSGTTYSSNIISLDDWIIQFEANGAVFLSAAGYRDGGDCYGMGSKGAYWSVTSHENDGAYVLYFFDDDLDALYYSSRYGGFSVRLVRLANN